MDRILNADFHCKISFVKLEEIVVMLDKTSYNNHPISQDNLDQLKSLYDGSLKIKQDIKNLSTIDVKELEDHWSEVQNKSSVEIPAVQKLRHKILICKILFPKAVEEILNCHFDELEAAFEDFTNKKFRIPGVNFEASSALLEKKIAFTQEIMKKKRKDDTLEQIQDDIMQVRQKGVLLIAIDKEYHN